MQTLSQVPLPGAILDPGLKSSDSFCGGTRGIFRCNLSLFHVVFVFAGLMCLFVDNCLSFHISAHHHASCLD